MSRTNKDKPTWTKKELVIDPLHRKAGPHKKKNNDPKICPVCRGRCSDAELEEDFGIIEPCKKCNGEGVIYK